MVSMIRTRRFTAEWRRSPSNSASTTRASTGLPDHLPAGNAMGMIDPLTICLVAGMLGLLGLAFLRRRIPVAERPVAAMHMSRIEDEARPMPGPLKAVPSVRDAAPAALPPALAEQLMFFRLAERVGEAVLLHDDQIRYANPAAEALLAGGESLLGRRLADMTQPGHADSLDAWLKARHAGRQSAVRLELRDAHDLVVECELSGFPIPMDSVLVGTVVRPTREALLNSARQQGTRVA